MSLFTPICSFAEHSSKQQPDTLCSLSRFLTESTFSVSTGIGIGLCFPISQSNRIEVLDNLKGCLALQVLDISRNSIRTICGIRNLTKLTNLNLAHNQIESLSDAVQSEVCSSPIPTHSNLAEVMHVSHQLGHFFQCDQLLNGSEEQRFDEHSGFLQARNAWHQMFVDSGQPRNCQALR